MRTLVSLATLAACGPAVSAAEFHAAQSPSGETVSVAVVAKRDCKANVIGLQLYEMVLSGEVGAAVLYHAQYYRTDDRAIAADEESILVKGFPSRDTVEIEERKESKHWPIDRTAGRPFDDAVRRLAENPESTEVVLDLYKKFRAAPFPQVTAPDRKSVASARWIVGKELCDGAAFSLAPSSDYGNLFTAGAPVLAIREVSSAKTPMER